MLAALFTAIAFAVGTLLSPAFSGDVKWEKVYEQILPSVVRVQDQSGLSCTGWSRGGGYYVTANHCVEHGFLYVNGHQTELVATEGSWIDLALLFSKDYVLPPLEVAESTKVGQQAMFVGFHEFSENGPGAGVINIGSVSDTLLITWFGGFQRGASGGPIVNEKGEVLGIVSWSILDVPQGRHPMSQGASSEAIRMFLEAHESPEAPAPSVKE